MGKKLSPEERIINKVISSRISDSKTRAKKKGLDHDIDSEYIKHLLKVSGGKCPLTGKKFIIESNHPDNFSVDRIDSRKGYVRDNVWLVTDWANKAKSNLSLEDFLSNCNHIRNNNLYKIAV